MEEEISGEISLNIDHNYKTVQKTIAKRMLDIHGDKAYMLVLIEMEDAEYEPRRQNWREILTLMEQIEKEKQDASN
jgi:hypothetical protein